MIYVIYDIYIYESYVYIYIIICVYIYISYIYISIVGQLPLGSTPDAVLASKGFRCCSGSRTPQDLETLRRHSHGIQVSLADVGEPITGCWFQRRNILKWPGRKSWFTHEKWWCSLIFHSYVNVYQRVPLKNESGWWFQSSWKYESQWEDYPIYEMENNKCSKPPTG